MKIAACDVSKRSTMSTGRMSRLDLMYIRRDREISVDYVMDTFVPRKGRQLAL